MEIIKKGSYGPHRFLVTKDFRYGGKTVQVDEEIEIGEPDAGQLVAARKVMPIFPEPVIECIAVKSFHLPGLKQKFEAKPGEKILIKRGDLLPLLLSGLCIPKDKEIWRPLGRTLKK